jgi:hypothetical protein
MRTVIVKDDCATGFDLDGETRACLDAMVAGRTRFHGDGNTANVA